MNGYYEFNIADVNNFSQSQGIRTNTRGNELIFDICPYCRSKKDRGTFSVNVKTGQYQCKRASCGVKGNMITLAKDFGLDLGRGVNEYYNINNVNDKYKSFGYFTQRDVNENAINYLQSRGISPEITQRYQITVRKDNNNILCFPFLDENSNLITIKYRDTNFIKGKSKNKEWFEAGCKPVLFGIYQCVDNKRLVITEGQIDALSVAECGINNAVSVPNGANGFTWVPFCWDWVNRFEEIIVFGDCETGEITLVETIKSRFSRSHIKVVRVADYKECKDANEILQKYGKDAVIHAIENAIEISNDGIKRAESVERVNYRDQPAVSTGVVELNKAMEGGLRAGDFVIVSGERGDGKSTFVSQMACFMLNDQNSKIFMYSGELVDSQVMEWLNSQLAGTKTYDDMTLNKMREWYAGRLYLYDNEYVTEDDNDVYNRCVTAIQKYGCNIIILDNLMTAMGSADSDIYRQQSKFTRDCARLSKEYKVIVILIAHPNKNGIQGNNNSISGSADITNNATYILWYQRGDQIDQSCRNLILSKNRTNGELIKEGKVTLKYDSGSRRIFDDYGENMRFRWDCITDTDFYEVTDKDPIPF